jgi:hypothetical protein
MFQTERVMNLAYSLVGLGLVGLLVLPTEAQQRQVDYRVPADISFAGGGGGLSTIAYRTGLSCIQRILDQANGGCLAASSTPTFGMLTPYPGTNNVFDASMGACVGGGEDNQATGIRSTIGGGYGNTASGFYATVGGGGSSYADSGNTASGDHATIGGGLSNTASVRRATIAGGGFNNASGESATIGGGNNNTASGFYATVVGGRSNLASGIQAMVGGGDTNTASGIRATVPGGVGNMAAGSTSFAAGRRATAIHDGSFVWGDSHYAFAKTSSVVDQFNVYASGGARFFSNSAGSTGVLLAPGGGSWTAVSDRNAKENVEPVDALAVLERVVSMPLATWNYKEQADSIRHMGPMAQDFYAAFGLGLGETTIDTIDPDGVALAAIQGVNEKLEQRLAEKDVEIEELRERLERLETLLSEPRKGR